MFLKPLIARCDSSFTAPGPSTRRSAMWNDRLKSTQVFCQACCSSRQLVYSGGTPGYTFGPVWELRSRSTGFAAAWMTSSRLFMQASDGGFGAPAFGVRGARLLRVGHRADDGADLDLAVPLHRRLARAAAGLAPRRAHFVARLDVGVDDADREHRALVGAVAREYRQAVDLALVHQLVVRG